MSSLNYRSSAVAVVCIFIYLYACCYIHTSLKICNPGISIFVKVLYAVLLYAASKNISNRKFHLIRIFHNIYDIYDNSGELSD